MAIAIVKGGIYTFTTIHPGFLGSVYEKVLCGGDLDYDTAKLIDPDIDSKQEAVKPYLPANASSKHTAYTYYAFTTQTKERKVFAAEWINLTSIKEENEKALPILIKGADESNLAEIRNVLGLAGWNMVNIIK